MDATTDKGMQGWLWVVLALLAALGVAITMIGAVGGEAHLVFGGVMMLLIAASARIQHLALRPGREDSTPSNAEKSAWSQIGVGLAVIMVLGGVSLGSMQGKFASYLLFAAYALIVAFYPLFRRRFIEENRRYREVAEDERDRVIRAQGDYLSKRLLELSLVALAVVWLALPQVIQSLGGPLQIAALLLLPILAANVAGESRVAWLHWRDRQ